MDEPRNPSLADHKEDDSSSSESEDHASAVRPSDRPRPESRYSRRADSIDEVVTTTERASPGFATVVDWILEQQLADRLQNIYEILAQHDDGYYFTYQVLVSEEIINSDTFKKRVARVEVTNDRPYEEADPENMPDYGHIVAEYPSGSGIKFLFDPDLMS